MAARIVGVIKDSIAEDLGVEPGDILQGINGHKIMDMLDYEYYSQDEQITLEIKKADGEVWLMDIEKDPGEEPGLLFDGVIFDRMKKCRNRCVFCFIDQLPPKMRKTLYVKDDDYRYSFLQGNFITLTNMKESDWEKLLDLRLSPLYVSVHCLRPEVRAAMLNNPLAAGIKAHLQRLYEAGIEVHTQVVLCPGINDGEILQETVEGLAALFPSVQSVGIVPVGLTGYREGLAALRPVTREESRDLIEQVNAYQQRFRSQLETGFVYLADEFFIKTGQPIPAADYYDEYQQIENGIGLARQLLDEFDDLEAFLPQEVSSREYVLLTGEAAFPVLHAIAKRLQTIKGLTLELVAVSNAYFGGMVTVTGLVTGNDIIKALGQDYRGKKVILPGVMLKKSSTLFLDNLSVAQVEEKSGAAITVVDDLTEAVQIMMGDDLIPPRDI